MAKTAFENRTNAYSFDPDDLVLVTDPSDPLYDPRVNLPLDEGLVLSMMSQGFFGAIEIAKRANQAVVINGRQRTRAAREANKRLTSSGKEPIRVTAVIVRGDESELFGVTISANLLRQDDTPLEKARKVSKYLSMGRTEQEASNRFGVTVQCVRNWLKLLECSAPVRRAVEAGKLPASAAVKLHTMEPSQQNEALQELLAEAPGKKVSTRRAAAKAQTSTPVRRGVREIRAKLAETLPSGWRAALMWTLGEE